MFAGHRWQKRRRASEAGTVPWMGQSVSRTGYGIQGLNPDEWADRERIPTPKSDSKVDKWLGWAGRIRKEMIEEIFTNREAFNSLNEALEANLEIPGSDILDYWAGNYARSQAMAVRRQTDVSGQSVTLGRLLHEMDGDRSRLSRQRWVGQYEWGHQGRGDDDFDRWAYLDPEEPDESESGQELSALVISHDIERLNVAAAGVRDHVDRVIAHADEKPSTWCLTFGQLDRAIDVLGEVFSTYYTLLTCTALAQLYAVPQYDRLAPFRQAWIIE